MFWSNRLSINDFDIHNKIREIAEPRRNSEKIPKRVALKFNMNSMVHLFIRNKLLQSAPEVAYMSIRMYTSVCIHLYVFICMYTSVCTHLYVYICMYTVVCIHLYVYICLKKQMFRCDWSLWTHLYVYICMHVYSCMYTSICIHAYVYICMYTYASENSRKTNLCATQRWAEKIWFAPPVKNSLKTAISIYGFVTFLPGVTDDSFWNLLHTSELPGGTYVRTGLYVRLYVYNVRMYTFVCIHTDGPKSTLYVYIHMYTALKSTLYV